MNKFITKLAKLFLGISLAAGVGVAVSAGRKDASPVHGIDYTLSYTLDGTTTASGNAYATASTVNQSNIGWKVVGNTEQNPWRIGGKSLEAVDRAIYSTTAISDNIAKIEVSSGGTNSGLTANSLTITVHSTADKAANGTDPIATKTVSDNSNIANKVITFEKSDSTSWAGKYYRIVYNVTRTSSSGNGYIVFNYAKLYTAAVAEKTVSSITVTDQSGKTWYQNDTVTASDLKVVVKYDDNSEDEVTNGSGVTITAGSTLENVGTNNISVSFTNSYGTATGSVTITAVEPRTPTELTVSGYKSQFTYGEAFSTGGLEVKLHYDDEGDPDTLTSGDYTVDSSDYSATTAGQHTITVSHKILDLSVDYTVTVAAKVAVSSVSLDETSLNITVDGNDVTLTATVLPNNAYDKTVTWESSNNSVATVNNGVVHPVAVGSATITCKSNDDNTKQATCSVTIKAAAAIKFVGGSDKGSASSGTGSDSVAKDGVTIAGTSTVLGRTDNYRFYSGCSITVSSTIGAIKEIKYTRYSEGQLSVISATGYSSDIGIWSGTATSVSFSVSAKIFISEISVKVDRLELTMSGNQVNQVAGSALNLGTNFTVTKSYSISGGSATVDSEDLVIKLGGESVPSVLTKADDGKTVTVSYTDANSVTQSVQWDISVAYKATSGVTVTPSSGTIGVGKSIVLTASVSDQYADPNVVWASSNQTNCPVVGSGTNNITGTVTGNVAGTYTITATSNGVSSSSVTIEVSDEATVTFDASSLPQTIYSGGDEFTISAELSNFDDDVAIEWSSSDDSIFDVDTSTELTNDVTSATFMTFGSGSANVQLYVLDSNVEETYTYSVTVTQSAVQSITLTVSTGENDLYQGDEFTLTPNVTGVGNYNDITWSVIENDSDVTLKSSSNTSATYKVNVNAVRDHQVTIKAQSITENKSATFSFTVKEEKMSLTWSNRTQTVMIGDLYSFENNTSLTVSYLSSNKDSIVINKNNFDDYLLEEQLGIFSKVGNVRTPIDSLHEFDASDHGISVGLSFTDGDFTAYTSAYKLNVVREVIKSSIANVTYDFSTNTTDSNTEADADALSVSGIKSGDLNVDSLDVSKVYLKYSTTGFVQLASGKGAGYFSITLNEDINVMKAEIYAKQYDSDETTLTVNDTNVSTSLTGTFTKYEYTPEEETNEVSITAAAGDRICIQKVVVYAGSETNLSKTTNAIALADFIKDYMHPEIPFSNHNDTGYCLDDGDNEGYFTQAKNAFNALDPEARKLFKHNAFKDEYDRLMAWAAANGYILGTDENAEENNKDDLLIRKSSVSLIPMLNGQNTNTIAIIVIISMVSVTAIGGYFFLRKRKEQ